MRKGRTLSAKALLAEEREHHERTRIKLAMRERELHDITASRSYRLVRKLALAKGLAVRFKNRLGGLRPSTIGRTLQNKRYVEKGYTAPEFAIIGNVTQKAKVAVIIHLYYPEMADVFKKILSKLPVAHDVYVSLPDNKYKSSKLEVQRLFPEAHIVSTPNCGRDVLPFVRILEAVKDKGYTALLKMHSKKSPHIADGEKWRDEILEQLVPSAAFAEQAIELLRDPEVALIGPEGQYVSYLVNYASTAHHTQAITRRIFPERRYHKLNQNIDEYGFFGGTMFWSRPDTITAITRHIKMGDFEPELGQEDSTLAHALERLFCVVPEVLGKKLYSIGKNGIQEQPYHSTNIPEWAEENPNRTLQQISKP